MGKIIIQEETCKNPLELMGKEAGVCWGADITDSEKNIKRGLSCLKSGHWRVLEYVQVYIVLDGYSCKLFREWYTHIGGSPTRLQSSTRYINYDKFDYVIPHTIEKNFLAKKKYQKIMNEISNSYKKLLNEGIPVEDAANILPLGMTSKVITRTNLRQLIDMSHQRMCSRAYWEYRELMHDLIKELSDISPEWEMICKEYFKPKCEISGYCEEAKSCGRKPKKD